MMPSPRKMEPYLESGMAALFDTQHADFILSFFLVLLGSTWLCLALLGLTWLDLVLLGSYDIWLDGREGADALLRKS